MVTIDNRRNATSLGSVGGKAEWRTPPALFAELDRRYRFDYDAFASYENALCIRYSTAVGTYEKGVSHHLRLPDRLIDERDGLTYPWEGRRVFLNPPFSRGFIDKVLNKVYSEIDRADVIVALLPDDRSTRWYRNYIKNRGYFIEEPAGRLRYGAEDGRKAVGATFASIVVTFVRSL